LSGQTFTEDHIVLSGFQRRLLYIDQIRGERIFLRRVDPQHYANSHAACALENDITGTQWRNAINAL